MQQNATVVMLYDTLDSLVALKLDLALSHRPGAALAPEHERRMAGDIDHSIDNIRAVLARLEGPASAEPCLPEAALSSPQSSTRARCHPCF